MFVISDLLAGKKSCSAELSMKNSFITSGSEFRSKLRLGIRGETLFRCSL